MSNVIRLRQDYIYNIATDFSNFLFIFILAISLNKIIFGSP